MSLDQFNAELLAWRVPTDDLLASFTERTARYYDYYRRRLVQVIATEQPKPPLSQFTKGALATRADSIPPPSFKDERGYTPARGFAQAASSLMYKTATLAGERIVAEPPQGLLDAIAAMPKHSACLPTLEWSGVQASERLRMHVYGLLEDDEITLSRDDKPSSN